jgi:hypothetical protein
VHLIPEQLERILMHLESFLVIFTHREKELEWGVLSQVMVYSANFNLLEGRTEYKHIANDNLYSVTGQQKYLLISSVEYEEVCVLFKLYVGETEEAVLLS